MIQRGIVWTVKRCVADTSCCGVNLAFAGVWGGFYSRAAVKVCPLRSAELVR
jgi:hypothetical protein